MLTFENWRFWSSMRNFSLHMEIMIMFSIPQIPVAQ